jgi:hypothetical protein
MFLIQSARLNTQPELEIMPTREAFVEIEPNRDQLGPRACLCG